jgi:hypothetical protein
MPIQDTMNVCIIDNGNGEHRRKTASPLLFEYYLKAVFSFESVPPIITCDCNISDSREKVGISFPRFTGFSHSLRQFNLILFLG